jgi:phage host-nuclease inhibitor protein Gam
MEKGTHGNDEKTFEELDYAGQTRTLNAQIQVLQKGLKAHIRKGETENRDLTEMKYNYKEQLLKLVKNLE